MPIKTFVFASEAALRRQKPPRAGRVKGKYAHQPGLYIYISSSGAWQWQGVVKDHAGKVRQYRLGNYIPSDPESGLTLAQAVDLVESARQRARAGRAPWEALQVRKERTFAEVRDRFLDDYVSRETKPNTQIAYNRALKSRDLRDWEFRSIDEITRDDIEAVLSKIEQRGALIQGNRQLAYLRKFFSWCADKRLIDDRKALPTDRVKPLVRRERPRNRVLSEKELAAVWVAAGELNEPFASIVRLLIATGQRRTEVAGMRWSDIDLERGVWTQFDNKAGRQHVIPLNSPAIRILKRARALCPTGQSLVFSTTGSTPPSGFSKAKKQLDTAISNMSGMEGELAENWKLHDLRRSFTTHLRRLKVSKEVCAGLLNHAKSGVTGVHYDHYEMLDEKTEAMEVWARFLDDFIH